jgi:hypothetical protein
MNGEKWVELRQGGDTTCPMCGKQDWCSQSPDGGAFDCKRGKGQQVPAGFQYVKDSAQGVIIKLIDQSLVVAPTAEAIQKANVDKLTTDQCNALHEQYLKDIGNRAETLAKDLGVSRDSLSNLEVGYDIQRMCFTFPERDHDQNIIGFATRGVDGKKLCIKGSRRAATIPNCWDGGEGPIFLVEGASDVAACITMGMNVLGRPGAMPCDAFVHAADELLGNIRDRKIIVVAEWDEKDNGDWPGKEGAIATANRLYELFGFPIYWSLPPQDEKDCRTYLNQHGADGAKAFSDFLVNNANKVGDDSKKSKIERDAEKAEDKKLQLDEQLSQLQHELEILENKAADVEADIGEKYREQLAKLQADAEQGEKDALEIEENQEYKDTARGRADQKHDARVAREPVREFRKLEKDIEKEIRMTKRSLGAEVSRKFKEVESYQKKFDKAETKAEQAAQEVEQQEGAANTIADFLSGYGLDVRSDVDVRPGGWEVKAVQDFEFSYRLYGPLCSARAEEDGDDGWLTTDYIEFEAEEFRDPRLFVRKVYEKVSINLDNPVGVWATIWNGQPPQRATRTQRAVEGTRGLHYWLTHNQELEVAKIDQSEISMIASKVVGWMDGLPEADEPDVNGDGRRIGSDIYVHSPMMRAEIFRGGNMIDKKRLKEFFEIVKRKVGYPVFNTRNIRGMAYTRLTMKDQTAIRDFQSNLLKDINTKKTFIQKRAASNGDAANSEHLPTGLFEKN